MPDGTPRRSRTARRCRTGLLLCLILATAVPAAAQPEPGAPEEAGPPVGTAGRVALFVLAGQSNMSGRGALPETDTLRHPRVFVFGNDYRWHEGREPVDDATGQVDVVSADENAGVGPSMAFGIALAEAYPEWTIGLIPCAKGATIVEAWQRDLRETSLYGSCLKRVGAAATAGSLAGMIFLQGESDAHHGEIYQGLPRRPALWRERFERFVEDFRTDVRRPDLPVVFAQIGPHASPERYVNWERVQQAQADVRLDHARMIRTADLALRDRVHFDTPSYLVIGRRFAGAMHELLAEAGWSPPASVDLQGHRGARGLRPENTLPSFTEALDLGVTTLEMDVVVTSDRRVLVSHEPWMSDVICSLPDGTPVPPGSEEAHNIYEMTYEEAAAYDCGSRGNPRFPEQRPEPVAKPLLDSVLAAAEEHVAARGLPAVRYNVEIKSRPERDGVFHPEPDAFAGLLYDVLSRHGVLGRTTVQSFDPRALEALRRIDPEVSTALLVDNDDGFEANLARLTFVPDIYSPNARLVDRALVEAAHARGLRVIPWTVNEQEEMCRLLALGVDGLITDYPDRGRRAVSTCPRP